MRISFDVDGTLICYQPGVPREMNRVPFPLRGWLHEPLRAGARDLLRELRSAGHEIWIYTTSLRSPFYMRAFLGCYGVRVAGVINDDINLKRVRRECGTTPVRITRRNCAFGTSLCTLTPATG